MYKDESVANLSRKAAEKAAEKAMMELSDISAKINEEVEDLDSKWEQVGTIKPTKRFNPIKKLKRLHLPKP